MGRFICDLVMANVLTAVLFYLAWLFWDCRRSDSHGLPRCPHPPMPPVKPPKDSKGMDRCCRTCKWWDVQREGQRDRHILQHLTKYCVRHSPIAINKISDSSFPKWPATQEDCLCGDWEKWVDERLSPKAK